MRKGDRMKCPYIRPRRYEYIYMEKYSVQTGQIWWGSVMASSFEDAAEQIGGFVPTLYGESALILRKYKQQFYDMIGEIRG